MSEPKKDSSLFPKSERERLLDAILGPDEEMSDELARQILETYDIDENQLLEDLKLHLQAEIRNDYDPNSQQSKNLINAVKSIGEQQRASSPESVEPKEWVKNFFDDFIPPQMQSQSLYAFRNREEGEMSDHDKEILDDLKAELDSEDE